jgi:hypothetical protein
MPNRRNNKRSKPSRRAPRQNQDHTSFFEKEFRIQKYSPRDRQVLRTIKSYQPAQITTSTTLSTFRSYTFQISNLSDLTEMSSVFDQYRITQVDVKFIPNITESLSSAPLSGGVFSVIDLDDANLFTSITDPLDYNSLSIWKPMETVQLSFKPRLALAAYGSSVFGSFANSAPVWIDCASSTVEHYGLKMAWGTTSTAVTYSPVFRLHVEWRMQH